MKLTFTPQLAIVFSCACWGLSTSASKILLSSFSPNQLILIQLGASSAFLWLVLMLSGKKFRLDAKAALLGVLEPGFAYLLGLYGLVSTSASAACLIGGSEPLLVFALSALFLRQCISARSWQLLSLGCAGILLITAAESATQSQHSLGGDALLLAGTLSAALYVVLSSKLQGNALALAAQQQLIALVLVALISVLFADSGEIVPLSRHSYTVLAAAALSGIVQYALALWLYLIALQRLPVGIIAPYFTLIPIFGILGALLILGEVPSLQQIIGGGLILATLLAQPEQEAAPLEALPCPKLVHI